MKVEDLFGKVATDQVAAIEDGDGSNAPRPTVIHGERR